MKHLLLLLQTLAVLLLSSCHNKPAPEIVKQVQQIDQQYKSDTTTIHAKEAILQRIIIRRDKDIQKVDSSFKRAEITLNHDSLPDSTHADVVKVESLDSLKEQGYIARIAASDSLLREKDREIALANARADEFKADLLTTASRIDILEKKVKRKNKRILEAAGVAVIAVLVGVLR